MLQLFFSARPGWRKRWLAAWLLGLLVGSPWLTYGQATSPPRIVVRVTPATATICAGTSQTLTAQAMYPPFLVGGGFNQRVRTLVVQADGRVLAGGDFTDYDGSPRYYVARLEADGSIDNSFAHPTGGTGFDANVVGLAVQPSNGKVLVGGDFTHYNNTVRNYAARLNTDGTLDPNFGPLTGLGFASAVNAFGVQSSQKIVVGGAFGLYNGAPCKYIARLNTNGNLDPTFISANGSGFNGPVNALAIQPSDDKIVVGGDFTTFYDSNSNTTYPRSHIARLNADGSLDLSFAANGIGPNDNVLALALQPTATSTYKVVVGGDFTSCSTSTNPSVVRSRVARLNDDGTLDTSFGDATTIGGPGLNNKVRALALQNGKVLVGGDFTNYSGSFHNYVARLNDDGTLDTSFGNPTTLGGVGLNGKVFAVAPHLDDKVLVGGEFASFNNLSRNSIARLTATGVLNNDETPVAGAAYTWTAGPTTTSGPTLVVSTTGTYLATATLNGATATANATVTVRSPPTITSFPPNGPINGTIIIRGTGFFNVSAVIFGGGVSDPNPVANAAGTELRATVPAGALPGPLTVVAACGTGSSGSANIFDILHVLVVQTPTAPFIQPGIYDDIIVKSTGIGIVTGGDVTVRNRIIVRDSSTLQLRQFHLVGPATFELRAGGTLSVGDPDGIAASGNTGAVRLAGTRAYSSDANYIYTGQVDQTTGTGLPARVRNLTDSIRTAATLTLTAPTSVAQVLTIASATDFALNGNALTLLSDASGTALVVNGPAGGKVVGTTGTMQRYIDPTYNTGTGYRYYSPPVAGATVATLGTAGFTPVVNLSYNTAAAPLTVSPFPTVFRYAEAGLSTLSPGLPAFDNGLYSPAALTEPLAVGAGYAVNIPATEKVSFTGTFTTGTQPPLNLTRSTSPPASGSGTGWNLVGNPYPAPLNWDLVAAADRPNLDAALYTYESTGPNAGIYFSYVNGVGGSPVVAAGKSFFVRVSQGQGSGSLTLRNSQRLTSYATQASFARTQLAAPEIDLELDYDGGKKGGRPPTAVYVDNDALPYRTTASAFDAKLDAYRIPATTNLNLSINPIDPATTSPRPQDEELAIKAVRSFTPGLVIPLIVRVPAANTRTMLELYALAIKNLPSGITPYLEDRQLNSFTNLLATPGYSFVVAPSTTVTAFMERFYLRFSPVTSTRAWSATGDVTLYPNPAHDQATVQVPGLPGATSVQATLLNELGQVIRHQEVALPPTGTLLLLDVRGLATGVYALRLQAGTALAVRRLVVE